MLLSEEGWSDSGKANQQMSTGLEAFTHHGGEQEHVTVALSLSPFLERTYSFVYP